jgi:hypothetical protein
MPKPTQVVRMSDDLFGPKVYLAEIVRPHKEPASYRVLFIASKKMVNGIAPNIRAAKKAINALVKEAI